MLRLCVVQGAELYSMPPPLLWWAVMDKTDFRTLKILEQIGEDEQTSQRRLADQLGISLGLANSFVKRLAGKGYFKIVSTPTNRFKYILTPKGFSEKTRLSYNYVLYSYQFYKQARHDLRELFVSLEREGAKRVIFHGVADFAEIAYVSLQEVDLELVGMVDDTGSRKRFLGHPVLSLPEALAISFDKIIVTDLERRDVISEEISQAGLAEKMIVLP